VSGQLRPVVPAPDPVLSTPAQEVDPTDDAVVQLCDDLVATMRAQPGCVGLAAPQIGAGLRAFVVDVTGHRKARSCHGLVVLVNPRLLVSEDREVAREGCLSVPDLTGDVARPLRAVVAGQEPRSGAERSYDVDAFEARAFCHELDHLAGMLFLDRVAGAHAVFARKRYL
jgi:peptide deformylase